MTEQTQSLTQYNDEIKMQLADDYTAKVLLATTFKKLDFEQMRQAILEGMIRGFTFKNFLQKDIYAIPFGKGYTLVTSIDYARKVGQDNGIVGVTVPEYEIMTLDDGKQKINSCTITVKKIFPGGYVGDFSAKVDFEEYYKAGKSYNGEYTPSMWDTKPKTMISKVAEMHALRKACPEKLDKQYVEEEMGDFSKIPGEELKLKVDDVLDNMETIEDDSVEQIVQAAEETFS